jgi:Uma2 family endonuclease
MSTEVNMSSVTNGQIEARTTVPQGYVSYEQFLEWLGTDENTHFEWVNGGVVPMAPVSDEHSDVTGFFITLLRCWVDHHKLGIVRFEPTNMKTGPDLPGRAPDVLFLSNENLTRRKMTYIDGPADLVVEVVSPGYRSVDRKEKFNEYEQGGVREYWIIDPERKKADLYQRGNNGMFQLVPPSSDGIYNSAVLRGLWLKVDWLWQRPLPTPLSVLKQWKLV